MCFSALLPAVRPQRCAVVGGGGLLLLGAVGFYGTHVEPQWIRTERVRLDVAAVRGRSGRAVRVVGVVHGAHLVRIRGSITA